MTDFTRDWIAKREQLEQVATEGPWFQDAWDPGIVRGEQRSDGRYWSLFESETGHDAAGEPQDAEFIADARTSLPAALAALKAVLSVHSPVPALDVAKRYGQQLTQVCTGCGTDDGNFQRWPCPTVRAVEAALRGES